MRAGDLVEIPGDTGSQVALVLGEEGRRLRLVTEGGATLLLAESSTWRPLGRVAVPVDAPQAVAVAERTARELARLQQQLGLPVLWELYPGTPRIPSPTPIPSHQAGLSGAFDWIVQRGLETTGHPRGWEHASGLNFSVI